MMHCAKVASPLCPVVDVMGAPATIKGGRFVTNGGSAAMTGQCSKALGVGPVGGSG